MPIANKYQKIGGRKNKNIYLVEYVPQLRDKLTNALRISLMGDTMQLLKFYKAKYLQL